MALFLLAGEVGAAPVYIAASVESEPGSAFTVPEQQCYHKNYAFFLVFCRGIW